MTFFFPLPSGCLKLHNITLNKAALSASYLRTAHENKCYKKCHTQDSSNTCTLKLLSSRLFFFFKGKKETIM